MGLQKAFVASLLLVGAHAGVGDLVAEGLLTGRSTADLERRMNYVSEVAVREPYHHVLARRQDAGLTLNGDGTINMTAWEEVANSACTEALDKLPESSNPSGTCICYNLPALDNVTGTFEADLRLFQLSTPAGQFAGIPPQNIQVGLSYNGASVSPVSASTAQKLVQARQDQTTQVNTGLKLLQTYLFIGQIDKKAMTSDITMAQLEALVMPTVTLTATNGAGQTVSTNVSSNEAAFVAGVFSQEVIMSDFSQAQAAVDLQRLALANGTVAFVLPGVQVMIFPVGLVVTSVWLVVGLAVIGFGTYERISYREQHKRRVARADKGGASRI